MKPEEIFDALIRKLPKDQQEVQREIIVNLLAHSCLDYGPEIALGLRQMATPIPPSAVSD